MIPPHVVIDFEIEKHYQNKTRFNSVHSKNNLLTIKNTAYLINLDEFPNITTHWITCYVKNDEVLYFASFGVNSISKVIEKFIAKFYFRLDNKKLKTFLQSILNM